MKRLILLALCFFASLQAPAQSIAPAIGSVSYQGLWWNAPGGSESGWGLNIAHQGNILFATWFTYDEAGQPLWLVIPDAELIATDPESMGYYMDMMGMYGMGGMGSYPTYAGTIYRTSGPAFDAATFDAGKVAVTAVGSATIQFVSSSEGTFTYSLNGNTGSKPITRQVFAAMPNCTMGGAMSSAANYSDMWWRAPAGSESGWGVNLTHQGDILFATWFTYGADGKGEWFVMSDGAKTGPGTYSGALYRTTGPAFSASPWYGSEVAAEPVGTATFAFNSANDGTFTYTVNGETQSKPITRQVYSSPATVCR